MYSLNPEYHKAILGISGNQNLFKLDTYEKGFSATYLILIFNHMIPRNFVNLVNYVHIKFKNKVEKFIISSSNENFKYSHALEYFPIINKNLERLNAFIGNNMHFWTFVLIKFSGIKYIENVDSSEYFFIEQLNNGRYETSIPIFHSGVSRIDFLTHATTISKFFISFKWDLPKQMKMRNKRRKIKKENDFYEENIVLKVGEHEEIICPADQYDSTLIRLHYAYIERIIKNNEENEKKIKDSLMDVDDEAVLDFSSLRNDFISFKYEINLTNPNKSK